MVAAMSFLVDTNVWLETLLGQARAAEATRFLKETPATQLALTEFSLLSIGIVLTRLGKASVFEEFVQAARLVREKRLDFDDAYQVTAATLHGLRLVSFDKDFEKAGFESIAPGNLRSET